MVKGKLFGSLLSELGKSTAGIKQSIIAKFDIHTWSTLHLFRLSADGPEPNDAKCVTAS